MFKISKLRLLQASSLVLLLVASIWMKPMCSMAWYQPKVPE